MNLHDFFLKQTKSSKKIFESLICHQKVVTLLDQVKKLNKENDLRTSSKWEEAFQQLHKMKNVDYAKEMVEKNLYDFIGTDKA